MPRYYATTMPFRRSAYGLVVESHEGRPTKIEGNASHPSTLGASSARVQASMLGLYDPDRSQTVRQSGRAEDLGRFRDRLGGAGQGACRGRWCRPGDPLRVLRLAHPGAPGRGAPRPLPEVARGRPTMPSATRTALAGLRVRHGPRPRPHAPARSSVGHPRPRRRPAPDRSRDDPSRAGLRGRHGVRRASGGAMNRLYAVEGVYSLTGAMADHRLRLESRQIAPFLAALAARLAPPRRRSREPGRSRRSRGSTRAGSTRWPRTCWRNRGKGLIVAGERQPAAVHAAVCALNADLGNIGTHGQLLRDEGRGAAER